MLIETCIQEDDKLYLCVSSPTIKDKPVSGKLARTGNWYWLVVLSLFQVQIRPWRLSDADYVLDASMPLDPRKTVFVGGVPRPLKASKSFYPWLTHVYYSFNACSWIGNDHGPFVWRRMLCGNRHWPWTQISGNTIWLWLILLNLCLCLVERRRSSCIFKSTELYCGNQCSFCAAAACGHWKKGTYQMANIVTITLSTTFFKQVEVKPYVLGKIVYLF